MPRKKQKPQVTSEFSPGVQWPPRIFASAGLQEDPKVRTDTRIPACTGYLPFPGLPTGSTRRSGFRLVGFPGVATFSPTHGFRLPRGRLPPLTSLGEILGYFRLLEFLLLLGTSVKSIIPDFGVFVKTPPSLHSPVREGLQGEQATTCGAKADKLYPSVVVLRSRPWLFEVDLKILPISQIGAVWRVKL